ncbi:MAG: hypothetical protein ACLQVG_07855, partial [Terriglobia bacterium]
VTFWLPNAAQPCWRDSGQIERSRASQFIENEGSSGDVDENKEEQVSGGKWSSCDQGNELVGWSAGELPPCPRAIKSQEYAM